MAHCPPELLDDLADVFAEIRQWPGVVERAPVVFYLRREPFLHFHLLADGRRRADVKGRSDWAQLELPEPVSGAARGRLLRELRMRYRERSAEAKGDQPCPAKRN